MHILTGLYKPTMGTALINNHDIRHSLDEIRQSLGFVPQHNILFSTLTVWEHLWFFSQLKHITPRSHALAQIETLLADADLDPYRNAFARSLSGGLKRKLSIAIALVGNCETLILDEPTAGVDCEGRHSVWQLLQKYKHGRTILMCTHQMDEAEALSDRVGIISNGKLVAYGSPYSLKRNYGSGYYLTLVKKKKMRGDEIVDERIMEFVKSRLNLAAQFVEANMVELKFTLSNEIEFTRYYEQFFDELEKSLDDLGVESFGLSDSNLDEVFVKVTEKIVNNSIDARKSDGVIFGLNLRKMWDFWSNSSPTEINGFVVKTKSSAINDSLPQSSKTDLEVQCSTKRRDLSGFGLVRQQFKALFTKR